MYVDGVANQRGSGVGLVLISSKKITIEKSLRLGFLATNNEAKYEALLVGMAMVQKMGRRTMEVFSDSRLVIGQVKGELKARDVRMQIYLSQARHLQSRFESFSLLQIPKAEIAMLILWPLSQHPWRRAYLGLSLLKTCVKLLR